MKHLFTRSPSLSQMDEVLVQKAAELLHGDLWQEPLKSFAFFLPL